MENQKTDLIYFLPGMGSTDAEKYFKKLFLELQELGVAEKFHAQKLLGRDGEKKIGEICLHDYFRDNLEKFCEKIESEIRAQNLDKNNEINFNVILGGHSMGGLFATFLLSEKEKIEKKLAEKFPGKKINLNFQKVIPIVPAPLNDPKILEKNPDSEKSQKFLDRVIFPRGIKLFGTAILNSLRANENLDAPTFVYLEKLITEYICPDENSAEQKEICENLGPESVIALFEIALQKFATDEKTKKKLIREITATKNSRNPILKFLHFSKFLNCLLKNGEKIEIDPEKMNDEKFLFLVTESDAVVNSKITEFLAQQFGAKIEKVDSSHHGMVGQGAEDVAQKISKNLEN